MPNFLMACTTGQANSICDNHQIELDTESGRQKFQKFITQPLTLLCAFAGVGQSEFQRAHKINKDEDPENASI